jgi:hypothetical protein
MLNRFVSAGELAEVLGVSRGWVYENAERLGAYGLAVGPRAEARRNGAAPRPRLRFPLDGALNKALGLLPCSSNLESQDAANASDKPKRSAGRTQRFGTSVPLLPIRGRTCNEERTEENNEQTEG